MRWTRPRSGSATVAVSREPEGEDIAKEVVSELMCAFPKATIASVYLRRCPLLIPGVAHRRAAAVVVAAHGDVIGPPAVPAGQAAERAVVEVMHESLLLQVVPRRLVPLAVGAAPFPEGAPSDLTEAIEADDLLGDQAPRAVQVGVVEVAAEADARQLHRVVLAVIEVGRAEPDRAAEAGQPYVGMAAEDPLDLLHPVLLLNLDVVVH